MPGQRCSQLQAHYIKIASYYSGLKMNNQFAIGNWVDTDDYLPPDGLHIRSRRGDIGVSWWAREWLEKIEKTVSPQALELGRRIARKSQVLDLKIDGDTLSATIQENRRNRFHFSYRLNLIDDETLEKIIDDCQQSSLLMAYLLSKQVPEEIRDLFQSYGHDFMIDFLSNRL